MFHRHISMYTGTPGKANQEARYKTSDEKVRRWKPRSYAVHTTSAKTLGGDDDAKVDEQEGGDGCHGESTASRTSSWPDN